MREAFITNPLFAVCIYLTCLPTGAATIVDTRAIADENQGVNWLSVGRTYAESHFSPLDKIDSRNVKQLGLAWYLDLPNQGPLQATRLRWTVCCISLVQMGGPMRPMHEPASSCGSSTPISLII